ncbi:hypothetical protein [Shimia biformata]|uniref:hypothetical protein n=1 Tax=Shimia biformata TaxID=1294299 RepID=UPI00194EDC62|nr:hypothetical protein [Shimia biformata]
MNAPRRGHKPVLPEEPAKGLAEAVERFARSKAFAYGEWLNFGDDLARVHAIINEIDETVLARKIRVTGDRDGAEPVLLTVSSRRLVAIEGIPAQARHSDLAEAVVAGLQAAFTGCQKLKFELVERNPVMPRSARSCSATALREVIQPIAPAPAYASATDSLIATIKAQALAWLEPGGFQTGADRMEDSGNLDVLERCAAVLARPSRDQADIRSGDPTLTILPSQGGKVVVHLEGREMRLFAMFEQRQQQAIVAAWRAYVDAANAS